VGRALHHFAHHPHHVLRPDLLRSRVGGLLRGAHHLHHPLAVPQIQEHEAPQVTPPVHPPAQGHLLPRVRGPQLPAPVRAHGLSS